MAESSNSYLKTSPLQAKWAKRCKKPDKIFLHAEVACVSKLRPNQLKDVYAAYVYRFNRNGDPADAAPCVICSTILKAIGVKEIHYTTKDNDLGMSYQQFKRYREKYKYLWCDDDCW